MSDEIDKLMKDHYEGREEGEIVFKDPGTKRLLIMLVIVTIAIIGILAYVIYQLRWGEISISLVIYLLMIVWVLFVFFAIIDALYRTGYQWQVTLNEVNTDTGESFDNFSSFIEEYNRLKKEEEKE